MSDSQSTYNFTLDDTSPVIKYTPYCSSMTYLPSLNNIHTHIFPPFPPADGDFVSGWQQWYSGNGFNNATGEDGIGDSFHISSFPGASFQLSFFGESTLLSGQSPL